MGRGVVVRISSKAFIIELNREATKLQLFGSLRIEINLLNAADLQIIILLCGTVLPCFKAIAGFRLVIMRLTAILNYVLPCE